MIDRVVKKLGRELREVPVGFNGLCPAWSTVVLLRRRRECGSSFLRRDGTVWTTDKDGPIMDLLAAEITAASARIPESITACVRATF